MGDSWLTRYLMLTRKAQRERGRRNVRAYRARQRAAGLLRVELLLTAADLEALRAHAEPGESVSRALSRLLSGKRGH